MEKYSFEKARDEAGKIKSIAKDIKENRLGDDPWQQKKNPNENDYSRAEKLVDSGHEHNLVSFTDSTMTARSLIEKYKDKLVEDYDAWDADGVNAGNESIRKFARQIPNEILHRYHGHGIVRSSEEQQLAALINICTNKCIVGEAGLMADSGYIDGYTHGDYLIISKLDESLPKIVNEKPVHHKISGSTSPLKPGIIPHSDEYGERSAWEANIGAVVVNLAHYPLVEEFKKMFPDVLFIKANELPEYIEKEVRHSEIQ